MNTDVDKIVMENAKSGASAGAAPAGDAASSGASASGGSPAPVAVKNFGTAARRGWVLLVLALVWLVIVLHRASLGPSAGYIPGIAMWIMGAFVLGLWCLGAAWALVTRGKFGVLAWAGVPVVLALGLLLPWDARLFPLRVRANEPELRLLAEEYAWLPAGEVRQVDKQIGGLHVRSISRIKDAQLLVLSTSSGRQRGLAYLPSGAMPTGPEPDRVERRLGEKWVWFDWPGK